MILHHLLFNERCEFLGEIQTKDGVFVHSVLPGASHWLEMQVDEWRAHGIEVLIEEIQKDDLRVIFGHEQFAIDHREFAPSLRKWCDERSLHCLDLNSDKMASWNTLLALPLSDKERFYLAGLMHASTQAQFEHLQEDIEHIAKTYAEQV